MVSLPSFRRAQIRPTLTYAEWKKNLCREEMRPWPRLAKALKCGSALERFSRAGIMQSLQSRPPGQLRNEKASWSKTPWFEQGLRPNPSYWTYDPYDLELELYPENCETRHSSSCVNSFGLHASVRPYSLSRSNQVCKKAIQSSVELEPLEPGWLMW